MIELTQELKQQISKLSCSDLAQLILKLDPTMKRNDAYNLASRLKKQAYENYNQKTD